MSIISSKGSSVLPLMKEIIQKIPVFGIYLHFPWCLQKCDYCDFYSIPAGFARSDTHFQDIIERYTDTVIRELHLRKDSFSFRNVTSIYFGGGTSSLLPAKTIESILQEISSIYNTENCEITLEGNPENFNDEYIHGIAKTGVNRINAGFQSFSPEHLKKVNRFFRKEQYETALLALSRSPVKNWGGDLIYGLPGQSEDEFYSDLRHLLSFSPKHLSLYSLTVEQNTALYQKIRKNIIPAPDEKLQERILSDLPVFLDSYGFKQYEVSNFAINDSECRHNLNYWMYRPYMGLGPGAHGFNGKLRYGNARSTEIWFSNPVQAEFTAHFPAEEIPIMLLRLTAPVSVREIFQIIDRNFSDFHDSGRTSRAGLEKKILKLFGSWSEKEFLTHTVTPETNTVQWTSKGIRFLDTRISEMSELLEKFSD